MSQRVVIDYNKLGIMVLLGAIFYNEYLAYFSNYASWPSLPVKKLIKNSQEVDPTDILKILFVADAQIQGYLHEGTTGAIKRWDSDRYLAKTFGWAMYAYDPQVVVFLGDLIDEGSEANDDDYLSYVIRFKNIYTLKQDERWHNLSFQNYINLYFIVQSLPNFFLAMLAFFNLAIYMV